MWFIVLMEYKSTAPGEATVQLKELYEINSHLLSCEDNPST
jgi:hypothetical protein